MYIYCHSTVNVLHFTAIFYRDKDDVGVNDIPTEENEAYASHSIKNILPDSSNPIAKICLEANSAHTSHDVKQTIGKGLENKVYEQVDLTPYNQ